MDNIPYSYFINNFLVDILSFIEGNFDISFINDVIIIINIFLVFNLSFNHLKNLVYDGMFHLLNGFFYSRIYFNLLNFIFINSFIYYLILGIILI